MTNGQTKRSYITVRNSATSGQDTTCACNGRLTQRGAAHMSKPGTRMPLRMASPRSSGGEDFVSTFNQVRPDVISKLHFILGNYDDAQDAIQEAFLKCWRRLEKIKGVRNLRG
jgi:hypothetical protein